MKLRQIGLVLALLSWSSYVLADEYDAAFTRAIAAKERALDENDPARWQLALDLFTEATRLRATKESTYELGAAAARLKQDDVAVEAYEAALALGLDGGVADRARAFIGEKRAEMGRVRVVGPAGGEIWIAGRWRASLPLGKPLVVFTGNRKLELRAHGDREQRELSVAAGSEQTVDFNLRVARPTGPVPGGRAAQTAPLDAPPDNGRALAWSLTLGGAGLAVLGGATVLIAGSNLSSHRDRLSALCAVQSGPDACSTARPGEKSAAQSEVDSIATWKATRTGGWVGLGVGAVTAGIGLVLLAKPTAKQPPRTAFSLAPTAGGATLGLRGWLD